MSGRQTVRRETFWNLTQSRIVCGKCGLVAGKDDVEKRQKCDADAARHAVDSGEKNFRIGEQEGGEFFDRSGQVFGRTSLPVCRIVGEDGQVDPLTKGWADAADQDGATFRLARKLKFKEKYVLLFW